MTRAVGGRVQLNCVRMRMRIVQGGAHAIVSSARVMGCRDDRRDDVNDGARDAMKVHSSEGTW